MAPPVHSSEVAGGEIAMLHLCLEIPGLPAGHQTAASTITASETSPQTSEVATAGGTAGAQLRSGRWRNRHVAFVS